jgi:glycerol-3-phosphate acyltransferase PlsX
MQLLKRNKVEAVLSMGSTGTVMVAAIQILGTIAGIKRPAVGVTLWGLAPNTVMFDLGTNVDCRPRDLFNFATIGSVIAKKVSKIDNPTVAILSNGAEEGKGNRLVKETYNFFKESDFNFIGNVEGNDIPTGKANVIVCDGFVGNVLVKYSEGLGDKLIEIVKERLEDKLAEKEISSICNDLFEVTHIADVLGGAMIYGLDGLVWIGHGRSKASQFAQSLWQVKLAAETGLSEEIKNELEKIQYRDIGGEL